MAGSEPAATYTRRNLGDDRSFTAAGAAAHAHPEARGGARAARGARRVGLGGCARSLGAHLGPRLRQRGHRQLDWRGPALAVRCGGAEVVCLGVRKPRRSRRARPGAVPPRRVAPPGRLIATAGRRPVVDRGQATPTAGRRRDEPHAARTDGGQPLRRSRARPVEEMAAPAGAVPRALARAVSLPAGAAGRGRSA